MDPKTKQMINERFATLPKELQQAILSTDLRPALEAISKENRLHVDQAGMLETECILVLLGLETPQTFLNNLKEHLRINPAQAEVISNMVAAKIFEPIREQLKDVVERDHQAETAGGQVPGLPKVEVEELLPSKNDILHGIENPQSIPKPPVPTPPPATPAPTQPAIATITPAQAPVPPKPQFEIKTVAIPSVNVMPTSMSMVDKKLQTIVKAQKEEVVAPFKPKPTDPYREASK